MEGSSIVVMFAGSDVDPLVFDAGTLSRGDVNKKNSDENDANKIYTSNTFHVKGTDNAIAVFEYAASNSGVEWGYTHMSNDSGTDNIIGTSNENSAIATGNIVSKYAKDNNYNVRWSVHNHPGGGFASERDQIIAARHPGVRHAVFHYNFLRDYAKYIYFNGTNKKLEESTHIINKE